MLFKAEDHPSAERLCRQDPLVANEMVEWQVNEWIAEVGSIELV